MSKQPQPLIFVEAPAFTIATNTFINVPVILQYDNEPLIEMVRWLDAGFTSRFRIYNDSGDLLAAVESTQIHATEAGESSGISTRHEDRLTVCEMGNQTLFQIERIGAAAIKASAELHTPDGRFVVAHADSPLNLLEEGNALQLGGMIMSECVFEDVGVGIDLRSDGGMSLGRSRDLTDQKIRARLKIPISGILQDELEDAGFDVEQVVELRGAIFNAVDVAAFVVEYLDEAVIAVLAGVVANSISRSPFRRSVGDRPIGFSVEDSENSVIINVTGDGNWVQVHPRPEQQGGEE